MIKLTKTQILEWIKKNFGNNYKIAKNGEEIRINNPLSVDDGYHLWINVNKGVVNDFRPHCNGIAGSFLSFVMKYKKLTYKQAIRDVINGDFRLVQSNNDYNKTRTNVTIGLPNGFKKLKYSDDKIALLVKQYLLNRCVSEDKINKFDIGYVGLNVVFPYFENNELVYWQQRSISNKRFLFPSNTNKSDYVYGVNSINCNDPVIITESIFNALMFNNAVAVGGSIISDKQRSKIYKYGVKTVIVAFDNDLAGRVGTSKAYNKLHMYFDLYYSLPNGCEDWNDIAIKYGIDEANKILNNNTKKLDYVSSVRLRINR